MKHSAAVVWHHTGCLAVNIAEEEQVFGGRGVIGDRVKIKKKKICKFFLDCISR